MISLGVENLAKSTEFYKTLGWKKSSMSQDSISFMAGNNVAIGLYARDSLAQDIGVENTATGFSGIALALNFSTRDKVDQFAKLVGKAGGTIVKSPQEVFWGGFSGYFTDLDGHYWEIAHNPFIGFDSQGNLDLDREASA